MPNGMRSVSPWTISTFSTERRASRRRAGRTWSRAPARGCGVPVNTVTLPGGMDPHGRRLVEAGARAEGADQRGRRDAARLDVGGDPEAAQLAARLRRRLALVEPRIVDRLEREVERGGVVADVVLEGHRRLVGELVRLDQVLPPDLHAVDPQLARGLVHQALEQVRGLGPPGAADRVHRHGVGEDRLHLGVDRGDDVRPGEERAVEIGRDGRGERREIRPHVGERAHAQAAELAVGVQRQLGVGDVVPAVGVGQEGLAAVGGPLHRPADPLRRPEDQQLLGVVEDLRAEAAAHVGRHHAQLVLRHLQGERAQEQARQVRVLRRGVERVAVLGRRRSGRWRRAARWRWGRCGC